MANTNTLNRRRQRKMRAARKREENYSIATTEAASSATSSLHSPSHSILSLPAAPRNKHAAESIDKAMFIDVPATAALSIIIPVATVLMISLITPAGTILLSSLSSVSLSTLGTSMAYSAVMEGFAATTTYFIRGLANEYSKENNDPNAAFIGGLIGGAMKYGILGKSSGLGAANNFAYELNNFYFADYPTIRDYVAPVVIETTEELYKEFSLKALSIGITVGCVVALCANYLYGNKDKIKEGANNAADKVSTFLNAGVNAVRATPSAAVER